MKKEKSSGGLLLNIFLLLIIIFLIQANLTLRKGAEQAGASGPEIITSGGSADKSLMSYIMSAGADPSCKVCVGKARKSLENKKKETVKNAVTGMSLIPEGEYTIGSPEGFGEPDEFVHKVKLDAFYMDQKEVTTADFTKFSKDSGVYPEWDKPNSKFNVKTGKEEYYKRYARLFENCPDCPVIGVTWADASAYCESRGKRLPTEAEWETAARGGNKFSKRFSFNDRYDKAEDYVVYEENSGEFPNPVGSKKPNSYGLYDMHGNVWEWVYDFYDKDYYKTSPSENPQGPEKGKDHVIRGGSWAFDLESCRFANRASYAKANDDIGFRCAVSEKNLSGVIRDAIREK